MAGSVATDLSFFTGASTTSDCDSITGWSGSPTLDNEVFIEGAGALSAKISKATFTSVYTFAASVDLSDKLLIVWMNSSQPAGLDTQANGGLRIRVEDASLNWAEWYVGGSDNYAGSWLPFMVRTNQSTNRVTSATPPNYAAITAAGCVCKMLGSAAKVNFWYDAMRYGTYIGVYGGTSGAPASFDDILTAEASNSYGMVVETEGVLFTQCQILLGSVSAGVDTYFKDTSKIIVFRDRPVGTFYAIKFQGNATGNTEIYFGTAVGGRGVSGLTIVSAGASAFSLDASDVLVDHVGLYGCNIAGAGVITLPAYSVDKAVLSCNFENCDQVYTDDGTVTFCNFIDSTDVTGGAILIDQNDHRMTYCNFINNTYAVEINTVGPDYEIMGCKFSGSITADINNTSGGAVVIAATEQSDCSTYTGSTTINTAVWIRVYVKDRTGAAVSGIRVAVYKQSDRTPTGELMNEDTAVTTGLAEEIFNYPAADVPVYIYVRESPEPGDRYKAVSTVGTIQDTGLTTTIVVERDPLDS